MLIVLNAIFSYYYSVTLEKGKKDKTFVLEVIPIGNNTCQNSEEVNNSLYSISIKVQKCYL